MRRVVKGASLALLALAASLVAPGCADPEGELQEFAKRCKEQVDRGNFEGGTACDPVKGACDTTCASPAAGAIDGQFYFVMSPSVATTLPLVFLAEVTTTDANGPLETTWVLQPLSTTDGATPVGAPLTLGPMRVTDGGLGHDVPELGVVGEANPITGSTLRVEALKILSCPSDPPGGPGGVCEVADFYCGVIPQGTVVDPTTLDIAGSTWTMTRVSGPADYPERLTINCAGDEVNRPPPP
ncbi:MAG: hypothetical protein KIT72_11000 [Polyangiaceae bacterium]|nr:hypothetical protein [Polyangiaceae bacterium]MCW5790938.1 hypothetical protein [Polyangiaceae bacterium]